MVARAVLRGDLAVAEQLRFVGFDLLALAGEDLRGRPWRERDQRLAQALPAGGLVRRIESGPAIPVAHAAIVALGFEGTVLKRPNSAYRPGRHDAWRKHKARHTVDGVLLAVCQDRDGHWHAVCDMGGRRVVASAGAGAADQVGELVCLVYSRVDADGGLREARLAAPTWPAPAGHGDQPDASSRHEPHQLAALTADGRATLNPRIVGPRPATARARGPALGVRSRSARTPA
jgi:hypothetical protein